jgi:uncharacterized repeat protein (TIGR01451 family)
MRMRGTTIAGAVAGGALLAWAGTAVAVTPAVTCVTPRGGGFTGYFGYSNPAAGPVTIPFGPGNRFLPPGPANRGQGTRFAPDEAGRATGIAVAVDFGALATWQLDGRTAAASAASRRCRFDLAVSVAPEDPAPRPGEVVWVITVVNAGNAPVPVEQIDLSVEDLPPASLAGTPPSELLPGESLRYRTVQRTSAPADCGRTLEAAVGVEIGPGVVDTRETDRRNNEASATAVVTCITDLGITKTSDLAGYQPGDQARYTITVTNRGDVPVPRAAVTVSDPLIPVLTLQGRPPATLAPRASITYRGSVTISASSCGLLANTATVSLDPSAGVDAVPANNTAVRNVTVGGVACVAPPPPTPPPPTVTPPVTPVPPVVEVASTRLSVLKRGTTVTRRGGTAAYSIVVRNAGAATARGVVVRDAAPSGSSLTRRPVGASIVGGRAVWRIGELGAGRTRVLRVSVRFSATASGRRATHATATAANASLARGSFLTRIVVVRQAGRSPAVTG